MHILGGGASPRRLGRDRRQAINTALGGILEQHIDGGDGIHNHTNASILRDHRFIRHGVSVAAGSNLERAFAPMLTYSQLTVSLAHHQRIDRPPPVQRVDYPGCMSASHGRSFDDPRFREDERTHMQRMCDGDYYLAGEEAASQTKRTVRLLSLYEQAFPTDRDIARYLLSQVLGEVAPDVEIRPPLRVDYGHNISIGNGSWVNFGLTALDVASICIGRDVLIGPNCSLYTAIHPTEPGPRRAKWESSEPITIEDNVWLGGSVVVCPGVTIGQNSIVGAGAVVTQSIPADSLAVGNPARVIRRLDPNVPRALDARTVGITDISHGGR